MNPKKVSHALPRFFGDEGVTARLLTLAILISVLFGCNQVEQFVTPGSAPSIKIGAVLELEQHPSSRYGAELAVYEVNRDGGIRGIPLELVIRSNDDDSARSAQVAEELITDDGVVALIGPNFSRNAIEMSSVAQQHQIPMVATTATDPTITAAGDFVFLAAFADTFQGQVMAEVARDELGAKTAALLTQTDDRFSKELSEFFVRDFTALGGTVVAREGYTARDTDFTSQLTTIAALAPDIIFIPGFAPEVPLAIRQARTIPQSKASGITATFLGSDSWDDAGLLSGGSQAMEGSLFSDLFSHETADPHAREFIEAYRSMFGIIPDAAAAMGYDAIKLIATAMRRAEAATPAEIRDQIAQTRGYKGATSLLKYDENRHPQKSAVILKIKDGQVKLHRNVEP